MYNVHYAVDFNRFSEHFAQVKLTFTAQDDNPTLWLPTWIAGSYLIREFAKHISLVKFHSKNGIDSAQKIDKNRWQLTGVQKGDEVVVGYEVYCYDLSVRTTFVDTVRIFGNFSSLLLCPTGFEQTPCQISLVVPQAFMAQNQGSVLACGLLHREEVVNGDVFYHLESVEIFESYDYPFEIGVQSYFEFDIQSNGKNILHRFFISGVHHTDLDRLRTDVQKICQKQVGWLGYAPFVHYTFMTHATKSGYGGLEHINSTALITPRDNLPSVLEPALPSESYQEFLGLCSHEYFHAWWVKSVRPDVMITSTLQTEATTPLLWVFEGFTSYVDDFLVQASGVIGADAYAKAMQGQFNRFYNNYGRYKQSVAESSFDAWIKFYRPDENTANSGTSYYNKGMVVALYLDLLLNQHSNGNYRLFDLIKDYATLAKQSDKGRYGMTTPHLRQKIGEILPPLVCDEFFDKVVNGTDEFDLASLLNAQGFALKIDTNPSPTWGLKFDNAPQGLKITHAHPTGVGTKVGLSANDILVAVNHLKATPEWVSKVSQLCVNGAVDEIVCHAFRDDRLLSFVITPALLAEHITDIAKVEVLVTNREQAVRWLSL